MKRTLLLSLLMALGMLLAACGTDDDTPGGDTGGGDTGGSNPPASQSYDLGAQAYLDVADGATVTFQELEDGTTEVSIDFGGEIEGALEGEALPAHIHVNDVAEGGAIAITLEPVDATTGQSTTTVTNFDEDGPGEGAAVTYDELIDYDGYVNVHLSASNLDVIVASANIGLNVDVALPEVDSIADIVTAQAGAAEDAEFTVLLQALSVTEADNAEAGAAIAALLGQAGDDNAGPLTVLAPTDAAFQTLIDSNDDIADAAALLALPNLGEILAYHVLPGATVRSQVVAAAGAEGGTEVTTAQGSNLTLSTSEEGNILVDDALAITVDDDVAAQTNIAASNGVIHIIETVLMPMADEEDSSDN